MNTLTFNQFNVAVTGAKDTFKTLRSKHPTLSAYLVLSLAHGQAGIDESPEQLLNSFPEMLVDDQAKTESVRLLKALKKAENDDDRNRLKKELKKTCEELLFVGECQVEMRFNDLDYDLIEQLKHGELIDKNLTPRTRASIRVVLGKLEKFVWQAGRVL